MPASIAASVRGIIGLDDLPKFRPAVQVGERSALGPTEFAQAYEIEPLRDPRAGLTGAAGTIAVVARSNFSDGDVHAFAERLKAVSLFFRCFPGFFRFAMFVAESETQVPEKQHQ